MEHLDVLELELRRLADVSFVGFSESDDGLVVRVLAPTSENLAALRVEAERICAAHLLRRFVVEVPGLARPARVRLLEVVVRPSAEADEDQVEVHVGCEGERAVGRGKAGDPPAAAAATMSALEQLGARVPFNVEAAATFEHAGNEGVMLILAEERAGRRYGVAAASTTEEAAARATLHALNRYLSTQPLPHPSKQ